MKLEIECVLHQTTKISPFVKLLAMESDLESLFWESGFFSAFPGYEINSYNEVKLENLLLRDMIDHALRPVFSVPWFHIL